MMQILAASGVPLLYDQVRVTDDNNPYGYYEYTPVKNLHNDQSWLPLAQGHVVKIVSPLLFFLPSEFTYKVVLMERPLSQIVASQLKMRGRGEGTEEYEIEMARFIAAYQELLIKINEYINSKSNFEICVVNHNSILENPTPELERVAFFLGRKFDFEAASSAIKVELYRSR